MPTAPVITLPAQVQRTATTRYAVDHAGVPVYTGPDPDAAIAALAPLLEAEEEDVVVSATTGGVTDRAAAEAVLAEATIEVSAWAPCGYGELLDPAEYREHVEKTCRVCGREE